MHIKRRLTVVFALAAAAALATTGVAFGSASSTATFKFTPTNPHKVFKSGKLNVHTHTNYTGGTATDRARLYFDNAFKFNTSAVPKCNTASISGNIDMAAAMAACGTKLVGTGTALANAVSPGDTHACVLVFNGLDTNPSVGGNQPGVALFTRAQAPGAINCANPATNHNGNVTVLLQGPLANNPASLPADYRTPAPAGKYLDFNHITTASPLPLADFNVNIQKGSYVQGKCSDANKQWNVRTVFNYANPTASQTINSKQVCS